MILGDLTLTQSGTIKAVGTFDVIAAGALGLSGDSVALTASTDITETATTGK
jgi:hypothetical protein